MSDALVATPATAEEQSQAVVERTLVLTRPWVEAPAT